MAEEMSTAPVGGGDVTQEDKTWALLCWIPFIGWIAAVLGLVMEDKKVRPFIKYHAVQALALAIIAGIVSTVLSVVIIGVCVPFVWLAYGIYLAVQANKGEWVEIPVITDFCKNQGWI